VKILIGITQEPEETKQYLSQRYGAAGCLTEFGPFGSMVDALNWLVYLKSIIGEFEEIIPSHQTGGDGIWYGFAYENKV